MARGGSGNRQGLRGLGEEILVLVVTSATREHLTEWLKLPLELSKSKEEGDFLLKPTECCEIRRQGETLLNIVVELATPDQWDSWLQIPLECARQNHQSVLEEHLLDASTRRSGADPAARQGVVPRVSIRTAASAVSCCKVSSPANASPNTLVVTAASSSLNDASSKTGEASSSPCCEGAPRKGPTPSGDHESTSESVTSFAPAAAISCPRSTGKFGKNISVMDGGGGALVEVDELCLHRATMARDLPRMRKLLADGIDRNATDLWSCTALHRAAEQNVAEPVRLLITAGLNVGARDMEGYTALHFAAARGAEEAIVYLLAAGSSLNDRGLNGDTPLHSAVRFLSLPTARMLLEADADEQATNNDGHTPLQVTGVLPDGREMENQPDPLTAQGIRHMLFAAPARRRFRIWKRRAWFVMLRARIQACSSQKDGGAMFPPGKCGGAESEGVIPARNEDLVKGLTTEVGKCGVREGDSGVGSSGGSTEAESEDEAQSAAETKSATEADGAAKVENMTKAENVIKAENVTKADNVTKTEIAAETNGATEAESEKAAEADGTAKEENVTEVENVAKADSVTKAVIAAETNGTAEVESESAAEADGAFFELITKTTKLTEDGLFKTIAMYL